jgi:AraC-like DNA-binding protein
MLELAQRREPRSGPELDGLARALTARFERRCAAGQESETSLLADKILKLLDENFTEELSMSLLAERLGVSEGHFFRAFKSRFQETPLEHLNGLRLKHACQLLLNSAQPLGAIAKACGYSDQFYFSRIFSKRLGESPSAYRRGRADSGSQRS